MAFGRCSRVRAAVLALLIALPAAADDVCLQAEGELKLPAITRTAATGDVKQAVARCGDACDSLRTYLAKREDLIATVDPTGKLLFEIDDGYPARGTLWSLKTGKRISRFAVDDFGGPPPPVSFVNMEFVGRHVFAGDPNGDHRLTYDIYTGAMDILFQSTRLTATLVIEVDGMGRIDLRDYGQRNAPIVATRRVKSSKPGDAALIAHTIVDGDRATVVTEEPALVLHVDARKRTITKPRALARCK